MQKSISLLLGMSFLVVSACSTNAPTTTKQAGTLSKESVVTIKKGTVAGIKNVAIAGRSGSAARTVGSITGSILGSSVPYAGSIIGSLIGGAVGGEADKAVSKQAGLELTVQLASGERVVVTQLAETAFKVGDKVQLIVQDNKARVSHLQDNS